MIISSDVDIPAVKMDVQGFECNVLDEMIQDLANHIQKVKFDFAPKWRKKMGCKDLLTRFINYGFEILDKMVLAASI